MNFDCPSIFLGEHERYDSSFSNPQHQQKIEELVAIAKEQGYLTYEEINEILPMTFDSPEQIDQVLIYSAGWTFRYSTRPKSNGRKSAKKRLKELEGLPKRAEGTSDDPVRMYLKEMGSVPLLDSRRRGRDFQADRKSSDPNRKNHHAVPLFDPGSDFDRSLFDVRQRAIRQDHIGKRSVPIRPIS